MDIKTLVETLHPLERAVVPHLKTAKTVKDLAKASKLKIIEAERAAQWLENKGVVSRRSIITEKVKLGELGNHYVTKDLPEAIVLKSLTKPIAIKDLPKQTKLSVEECNVSVGILKRKQAITLDKGNVLRTIQGDDLIKKPFTEKLFLESLKTPRDTKDLTPQEQLILDNFKKRKSIVEVILEKTTTITLTGLGKKLAETKLTSKNIIDRLTPEHLKLSHWKKAQFRRYDVQINVPRVSFGRKQHYRSFLDFVRNKFASLGFTEMTGPIVESDFWNMDALYMPQFHSARDIHEAYYIKEPEYAQLPMDLVNKVKQAHENGYGTGSKGWRYNFDVKRTSRQVLRTHDTAMSPRMLASKDLKIPGKYFNIAKCFRYDVIDATHLPDFYQTGGFVINEGLNMSHLKGVLKLFAEEFAQTEKHTKH